MNNKKGILFATCYFIILFFLSAFRAESVGGDLEVYLPEFNSVSRLNFNELFIDGYYDREIGFLIIEKIISLISTSNQSYIVFTSLIFCIISYYIICKHSVNIFLSVFIYITSAYLLSFNIIRALMAGSICLLTYESIISRRFLKFLIIVMIASSVHITAISILPIYFLWNIKYKPYKILFFIFICLILSYTLSGFSAISSLINIFPQFASYENSEYVSDTSTGITTMAIIMVIITLIHMYLYKYGTKNHISELFIWISACATGIQFFASIFVLVNRISTFYGLFSILSISYLLNKYNGRYKSFITIGIIMYYIVLYIYTLAANQQAIVPYKLTF